jgi:hypothetical protein
MVSMFELGSFCAIKMRSPRMPTSPHTALSQIHDPDGSGFRCVDQQRIYQRRQNGTGPQPLYLPGAWFALAHKPPVPPRFAQQSWATLAPKGEGA